MSWHRQNLRLSGDTRRSRSRRNFPGKARDTDFAGTVVGGSLLTAVLTWQLLPSVQSSWTRLTADPGEVEAIERSVYYGRCSEARTAGAAPIYQGSPGYREGLDGDDDGIACEPYRRW